MPRNLVLQEWQARFGNTQPLQITPELEDVARKSGIAREEFVKGLAEVQASEFARLFKVPEEAMRIRLQGTGVGAPKNNLFS